MDLDRRPGGPSDLIRPGRNVSAGQARSWRGTCRFLGICLLVVAMGGPTGLPGTALASGRSAPLRHALTASAATAREAISFPQPPDMHVGMQAVLPATVSSGPPLSLRSDTPLVCTVSATIVTALAAGACTITASQAGAPGFAAAPDVARAFQVGTGAAPQTVTFNQPAGTRPGWPQTMVGGPVVALSASVTPGAKVPVQSRAAALKPGQAISFRSDTPAVCTVSGATTTGPTSAGVTTTGSATAVGAGACTITATQPGNLEFAAAGAARSFRVTTGRKPQLITFRRPEGTRALVMVPAPVTLSASATSRLPVSFRSATPLVCAVSGTTVLTLARGRCAITAGQGGSARFAAARDKHRSFMVGAGPASQSVGPADAISSLPTVPATGPATGKMAVPVGVAGYLPVVAAKSRLAVILGAATRSGAQFPPACAVSGTTVLTLAAGDCTITAAQGGSQRFAPASLSFPFMIRSAGKGRQSISDFIAPARAVVGVPFVVSARASSGLAVSFRAGPPEVPPRSGTPSACTVSWATVIPLTVGTCTVTVFQAGSFQPASLKAGTSGKHSNDYAAAKPVPLSIQVQDTQTITFAPPGRAVAGVAVPLTATASSGLPVSFRSDTRAVCTVSGTTVTTQAAGMCTITATQGGNKDYVRARDMTQSFRVKATQTIDFTQPGRAAAGVRVPLAATASSRLPVSFHTNTPDMCTVSAMTARTLATGTCTITATQGGNTDFAAARNVTQSFGIRAGQNAQTINFGTPAAGRVGTPVTLTASASSGLPVSFSSATPAVCTVSGATLTTLAAGTCTITATQGGSTTYAAARAAPRSFQVNPAAPATPAALIRSLAAAAFAAAGLAAAGGVLALRRRRLRLRGRPPAVAGPSVHAEPDPGPPGSASTRTTGAAAAHTVRINAHPGASTLMIKESLHATTVASSPRDRP
jgi:hypothetical protein